MLKTCRSVTWFYKNTVEGRVRYGMYETVLESLSVRFFFSEKIPRKLIFESPKKFCVYYYHFFVTIIQIGIMYPKCVPYLRRLLQIKPKSGYVPDYTKFNACHP